MGFKAVKVKVFRDGTVGVKKECTARDMVTYLKVRELVAFDKNMKLLEAVDCSTVCFGVVGGKHLYYNLDELVFVGVLKYTFEKESYAIQYDSVSMMVSIVDFLDECGDKINTMELERIYYATNSILFDNILPVSITGYRNRLEGEST